MRDMNPAAIILVVLGIFAAAVVLAFGGPIYRVWSAEKAGEAKLMEAKQSRQIRIEEAAAELEASKMDAKAEVERAKGMAEAMKIENGALTPEYIQYLWVRQARFDKSTTVYIPTEANLPILEASRAMRVPGQ